MTALHKPQELPDVAIDTVLLYIDRAIRSAEVDLSRAQQHSINLGVSLRDLQLTRVRLAYGVETGSRVRHIVSGSLGTVHNVVPRGYGRPWLEVNKDLKDGSPGAVATRWFDNEWELVK